MMHWPKTPTTPPTKWPVDIAAAKRQCRIEDEVSADDALVGSYVAAATGWVEDFTGRALMLQTRKVALPGFPRRLWLPYGAPNASIVAVTYADTANATQTLSSSVYSLVQFSEPACLTLVNGQTWPSTFDRDDAVVVEYTVGASSPEAVPAALVQTVLLLIGHWYENREQAVTGSIITNIPFAAEALCAPHRLFVHAPEWD